MTPQLYILDNDEPIEATMEEWSAFFASPERIVASDMLGDVRVSTVFIGMDMGYEFLTTQHKPVLWETMIFGGDHDQYQERYTSAADARAGHYRAVNLVLGLDMDELKARL